MVKKESKINSKQEQIHDLIFGKEIGWQEIIHDLINTEQIDPWDIDIIILTNKYLEKIQEFEEGNYFISGKVLLAAALLLRIKSEILLSKYIKSVDEILFGKKEIVKKSEEIIEFYDDIPELLPRSPLPRFKKVTLRELVDSLNKAIITENRRIKKEIIKKDAVREMDMVLPKKKYIVSDKIKEIYKKIFDHLNENQGKKKISFSELVKNNKEEKIISFSFLLHLENQSKIWIEQDEHFGEMYIWLKKTYMKHNPKFFEYLRD